MKRCRKFLAMVLTLTMAVLLVTSCGGGAGSDGQTSQTSQPASEAVASAAEETASSQAPAEDGQESEAVHKLTILGPDPGNPYIKYEDREEYHCWQVLQEMLAENNLELEIEVVPNDQYAAVSQTRVASPNNLPDIINLSNLDDATILSLAEQGTIVELSSLIEQYSNGNIDHMYRDVYTTAYPLTKTEDGKMYWFTDLHIMLDGDKEAPQATGVQIRQDWLDKLGLPMPTTLDEFIEDMRAFREKDVNGNGAQDELYLQDLGFSGLAQYFGLGNDLVALDYANGKIISPWYQDTVKDYFACVQQLVEEGIIDPATIGSWDMQNQRLAENMVGAWNAYDSATYLNDYVTNGAEGVDYEPVFDLSVGEGIEQLKVLESAQLVWARFAITKNCDDLEGAIKFFDMIYSQEYADLVNWGIEGETYEVRDGEKYMIETGSNEEKAQRRNTQGSPLWGDILPRVQMGNFKSNLEDTKLSQRQKEVMQEAVDWERWCPMMLNNYLAMPTDEETEIINRVTTGLTSYSEEISTKLMLGQASLDDFDSYLENLKELGLDELIEVQQARFDRFQAMME